MDTLDFIIEKEIYEKYQKEVKEYFEKLKKNKK